MPATPRTNLLYSAAAKTVIIDKGILTNTASIQAEVHRRTVPKQSISTVTQSSPPSKSSSPIPINVKNKSLWQSYILSKTGKLLSKTDISACTFLEDKPPGQKTTAYTQISLPSTMQSTDIDILFSDPSTNALISAEKSPLRASKNKPKSKHVSKRKLKKLQRQNLN